jgi:hypothetical protein
VTIWKLRTALAALFLLIGATTPNSIITAQTPNRGLLQFTSSSTAGNYATLYTAGPNGSKCTAIWSTNSDASATHLLTLQVVNTSVRYGGISIATTKSQGFASGASPLAILTGSTWPGLPMDSDRNPYLILAAGDSLQATFATAITSGAVVNLEALCSDF